MYHDPLISLIVRTKNEERWIGSCLRSVFRQTYRNFEVIIVDNKSTDRTVSKARQFPVTLVEIDKFLPGKALNDGIRASKGEILVMLSGHCIPVTKYWLENLVKDLSDPSVAGVYGRQEPLSFSSPLDKRDLLITFGLDRKIQFKDSLFHNANSALRREVWERFPFDEDVTNIEDRVWAKRVLAAGFKIIYEPEASVFHWHGIHHEANLERATNVVRIMESIEERHPISCSKNLSEIIAVALIPSRGSQIMVGESPLIHYTITAALSARYISKVFVATDNPETATLASKLGAIPLIRPEFLSEDFIDITEVLQWGLDEIEDQGLKPDLMVLMEETHPFRPVTLIDKMIETLVSSGSDSLVAAKAEHRHLWLKEGEGIRDITTPKFMPRQFKDNIPYLALFGLACVTRPTYLRDHTLFGLSPAIFEITESLCATEIRSHEDAATLSLILESWTSM